MQNDAELVALARQGDKQAFETLIERHRPMAFRVALKWMGEAELAQDIAQEALLHVYLSLDKLQKPDRFASWLYGIVLNLCRSYYRESKMDFLSWEAMTGGASLETPEQMLEWRETRHEVQQAVMALSSKNQQVVRLFYFEAFSLNDIAAQLEISLTAVKGRLYKARLFLKNTLEMQTMIPVKVVDVIGRGEGNTSQVLALLDEANRRLLLIWVGTFEGAAIAMRLTDVSFIRPMTFSLMQTLLEATGATVEKVVVNALKEEIFYGTLYLKTDSGVQEIDARPSDAIALALHVSCPIFVAEEVMQSQYTEIPDHVDLQTLGRGLRQFREDWNKPKPFDPSKFEEEKQQLTALIFGTA